MNGVIFFIKFEKETTMFNKMIMIGLMATLLMAGSKDVFSSYPLDEALVAGKTENKGVLVKFHADWCHFCRKMDKETFTDSGVQKALDQFITIKVDVDTQEGMVLARQYGVKALPTILMFDSKGNQLYQQAGFHSAAQLKDVLKKGNG